MKEFRYNLEEMKSTMARKKTGVLAREQTGDLIIELSVANSSYPVTFYTEERLTVNDDGTIKWTTSRRVLCRHVVRINDLLPEQDFSYFYIISLIATGAWADQETVKWVLLSELLKVKYVQETLEKEFPQYFERRNAVNFTAFPICTIYPEENDYITVYEEVDDSSNFTYSSSGSGDLEKAKEILLKALEFIEDKVEWLNDCKYN